jgi:hypothetical protein
MAEVAKRIGSSDATRAPESPPVVRCPGCQDPMEPKERISVTERLSDIRYVCATCGMETKRTVKEGR